jgi:serine/threonine protein kinase
MAEAKTIVTTTAKSVVCEFDPETGFAMNDAARASCVACWKGKAAKRAGAGYMLVDFEVLRTATNDFSDSHLLGLGASCRVFKANVYDYPTAIKCLTEAAGVWDDKQLGAEMGLLRRVSHPHINNLLAVSLNGTNRCLILEYLNGGALDTRLLSSTCPLIEWQDRALILLHVGRGLVYIHSLDPPVIHRDVKTGNVLLRYSEGPSMAGYLITPVLVFWT